MFNENPIKEFLKILRHTNFHFLQFPHLTNPFTTALPSSASPAYSINNYEEHGISKLTLGIMTGKFISHFFHKVIKSLLFLNIVPRRVHEYIIMDIECCCRE